MSIIIKTYVKGYRMRIGVNISEDLKKRMKPLMAISNISQICRDAIRAVGFFST